MEKEKNSLIKILAFIILLVIILVVSIPPMLENKRKESFMKSVELLEKATSLNINDKTYEENYTYTLTDGVISDDVEVSNIEGMNGSIKYDKNGNVSYAIYNDKWCVIKDTETTIMEYVEGECLLPGAIFTITYNLDGGTNEENVVVEFTKETDTFNLPTPIKEGYTFAGWYENAELTGKAIKEISKGTKENKTYYAKWDINSYTLTANANNGNIESTKGWTGTGTTSTKEINYESEYGVLPTPTRTGYTFSGWYTQVIGGTKVTDTTKIEETDTNIYAQWLPNNYSISYNLNGGTQENGAKIYYNVETTNFLLPTPSRIGYTFNGWYENAVLTGKAVTEISKGTNGNKTYYAKWKIANYSITYHLNGGTQGENAKTNYNIETNTFNLPIPIKENYEFDGWYENAVLTGKAVTEISKGTNGNKTYYAKWKIANYSITYHLNGGTQGENAKESFTKETETFNLPTPSKIGYTFDGWYDNLELTGEAVTEIEKGTEENKTYYAKWSPIEYTITCNLDGGTGVNVGTYTIESNSFTIKNPTKEGYTFKGWTGSNGEEPTLNITIEKGTIGNREYVANWDIANYSITYYLNGGFQGENTKTNYNVEMDTFNLPTPTKEEYTFVGWYDNSELTGEVITEIEKGTIGNKTYYAKWKSKYADGTPIYYDVLTGKRCTNYHVDNSITGYNGVYHGKDSTKNQNSCLKFYVFNYDEGEIVLNLLLDHNTTPYIEWTNSSTFEPKDILTQLQKDTNEWVGTKTPRDYTLSQAEGGNYTIDYDNVDDSKDYKTRLITVQEIAEITGADIQKGFDESTSKANKWFKFDGLGQSNSPTCTSGIWNSTTQTYENANLTGCSYGWLYDRTRYSCKTNGCLNNATGSGAILPLMYGYWTATSVFDSSDSVWHVGHTGSIGTTYVNSISYGVRPVIEVNKEVFEETKLITINPNGGSYGGTYQNTEITLLENEAYELEIPTREGYTFEGWIVQSGDSSVEGNILTVGNRNTTLIAKWRDDSLSV